MLTQEQYQYYSNFTYSYLADHNFLYYIAFKEEANNQAPGDCDYRILFTRNKPEHSQTSLKFTVFQVSGELVCFKYPTEEVKTSQFSLFEFSGNLGIMNNFDVYSNVSNVSIAEFNSFSTYMSLQERENNISYNISKNEYMLIPFLFAILILILFFKWCFPMKGGKSL